MIRYSLTCDRNHRFDSWFQSATAYDSLAAAGMVSCAICGSAQVEKALMAPALSLAAEAQTTEPSTPSATPSGPLSTPASPIEEAIAELRRQVEEGSEHVGPSFVAEARAMHEGRSPQRSIWGEARPDEARALHEDGIAITPLPFLPRSKAN